MKTKVFFLIFSIIILSCDRKQRDFKIIDDKKTTIEKLNINNLFYYESNENFYNLKSKLFFSSKGFYSNVKKINNMETEIFTKDFEYFVKDLDGKYIKYYVDKSSKVKLRIFYQSNIDTKSKKIENLSDLYEQLKENKISYKILKEDTDARGISNVDMLLTNDSLFCKVLVSKPEFISNVYYNVKYMPAFIYR